MNIQRFMFLKCVICAILPVAVLPPKAHAASDKYKQHPGYVDGSAFVELAGEEGNLVEVSLHGPLLEQACRAIAKDNEPIGAFVKQIVSISAVVIEKPTDSDKALGEMKEIAAELDDNGWDRLGRVREEGTEVWVYVLANEDDEVLDGLTVMFTEPNEIGFVNLAGRIDLELIGEFGGSIKLPGLDQLGNEDWEKEIQRYEESRHEEKSEDKDDTD
jgi:hypothetical protein